MESEHTKEERLKELVAEIKSATSESHKTIVEGRMLEVTRGMDIHPEWFDWGCECDECLSYGEN